MMSDVKKSQKAGQPGAAPKTPIKQRVDRVKGAMGGKQPAQALIDELIRQRDETLMHMHHRLRASAYYSTSSTPMINKPEF